jgi:hypothetical protein
MKDAPKIARARGCGWDGGDYDRPGMARKRFLRHRKAVNSV